MNMKWMSLVAVMAVFSSGCSDTEQDTAKKTVADEASSVTPAEIVNEMETVVTESDKPAKPVKSEAAKNEALNLGEGIPPEKLDSEVKGLVEKISENSEMSEEEAAKLEQDLKSVFQKIEAERAQ